MNRLTPRLSRYLEHLGSPIDFHLSKCNDHKQVELVIFIRDIPEDQLSSVLEDVEVLSKVDDPK